MYPPTIVNWLPQELLGTFETNTSIIQKCIHDLQLKSKRSTQFSLTIICETNIIVTINK